MDSPTGAIFAILAMAIPVVAIVGGITAGIVKTLSRQKMLELAQKERIAALERGVDPEKLPPLQLPADMRPKNGPTFEQRQLKRSNLLMIWGLIITFFGIALMLGLIMSKESGWAFSFMFVFVGIAFMAGSRVGRPSNEEVARSLERREGSPGRAG